MNNKKAPPTSLNKIYLPYILGIIRVSLGSNRQYEIQFEIQAAIGRELNASFPQQL